MEISGFLRRFTVIVVEVCAELVAGFPERVFFHRGLCFHVWYRVATTSCSYKCINISSCGTLSVLRVFVLILVLGLLIHFVLVLLLLLLLVPALVLIPKL